MKDYNFSYLNLRTKLVPSTKHLHKQKSARILTLLQKSDKEQTIPTAVPSHMDHFDLPAMTQPSAKRHFGIHKSKVCQSLALQSHFSSPKTSTGKNLNYELYKPIDDLPSLKVGDLGFRPIPETSPSANVSKAKECSSEMSLEEMLFSPAKSMKAMSTPKKCLSDPEFYSLSAGLLKLKKSKTACAKFPKTSISHDGKINANAVTAESPNLKSNKLKNIITSSVKSALPESTQADNLINKRFKKFGTNIKRTNTDGFQVEYFQVNKELFMPIHGINILKKRLKPLLNSFFVECTLLSLKVPLNAVSLDLIELCQIKKIAEPVFLNLNLILSTNVYYITLRRSRNRSQVVNS